MDAFASDVSTVRSQHASAGYRRSLTRNAGLRIGYGYSEGRYSLVESGQGPTRQHDLDIGVDYRRSLSLTRRVTFAFSTGSAIIQTQSDTHYRVVGNASLNAAFKRTWNANLTYDRGVEFVGGFEEPFFSDSLIASVGGLLSPRLSYRGTVSYSLGSVLEESSAGYDTGVVSNRLQYALTRYAALDAEHVYYQYDFDPTIALPTSMPQNLGRQGARVGLSVWLPVF